MKAIKIILTAMLFAFLTHISFKYFGVMGFINGWLSANTYFAIVFYMLFKNPIK